MKPYLYLSGLKKLAQELKGNERVHFGIRPYGFHGGNLLSIVVYPYLLCKELKRLGKTPKLRFTLSINDYEQDELDGPDIRKYPFNIYPKNTSLQFTKSTCSCCTYIADHWQPIIEGCFKKSVIKDFPLVTINLVRNSYLKEKTHFKRLLLETIKNPVKQSKIFKKYSGHDVLQTPIKYAGVICPKCRSAHGDTIVIKNKISWECHKCNHKVISAFKYFDYWWYHKAMLTARLKIFKTEVTMSGGDHYSEGDYNVRKTFMKTYFKEFKEPKMLFCPTLQAFDGQKMSKSRKNTCFINHLKLIDICEKTTESIIRVSDDMVANVDEKEYLRQF